MASERITIEIDETVKDQLLTSGQKESLVDMLNTAGRAANGAPDKTQAIAEAVQSMVIFLSRRERHDARRMSEAIVAHAANCPLRTGPSGRFALAYQFRWPLVVVVCVALVSPFAGPELAKLIARHGDKAVTQVAP